MCLWLAINLFLPSRVTWQTTPPYPSIPTFSFPFFVFLDRPR